MSWYLLKRREKLMKNNKNNKNNSIKISSNPFENINRNKNTKKIYIDKTIQLSTELIEQILIRIL